MRYAYGVAAALLLGGTAFSLATGGETENTDIKLRETLTLPELAARKPPVALPTLPQQ